MNGPIRLSGVDGQKYFINPMMITLFTKSTQELCTILMGPGGKNSHVKGASIVIINSLPLQVMETEAEILEALQRYRRKSEDNMIRLRDRINREDWEGECDDDA
jgi:hypothetical protein